MAAEMIPPEGAPSFLADNGWKDAEIRPLAGDASFRRYFRVHRGAETAVLMDAPPQHEDLTPFLNVAAHLLERGMRAPRTLACDREQGLLLLEDFGDDRVGPVLARDPTDEHAVYERAIDLLAALVSEPAPADLDPYDAKVMLREVGLFPEWYLPAVGIEFDRASYDAAWEAAWGDVLTAVDADPVLVLRDYHADNLMLLPDGLLGLLDFQDALAGHPAYDLVSLLQDARRDVSPALEQDMLDRFCAMRQVADKARFRADYEVLGAQRNTKILGIFTRLWKRDGKTHYLGLQARVWGYLERNLVHPALAPVRAWFDEYVPAEVRAAIWTDGRLS